MERRLTSILFADLVRYSAMMAADEERVAARLQALRTGIVDPEIELAGGRVVKSMGDGLMVEFPSPVSALRCALSIQHAVADLAVRTGDPDLTYRMGLHLGDVIVEGDDLIGDAVNVAARLEPIAPPGGVCLSRSFRDQVAGRIDTEMTALGPQKVKNLPEPLEVWRIDPPATSRAPARAGRIAGPTLAVLPFAEIGPPADDFLTDGIVEEITTALSCIREIVVIARQSAFAFRGRDVDIREIGAQLGARYVVTGSVRRSGDRLRVSVQLSEAETGQQLFPERYDDRLADLFDLQDRIASQVAGAILPSVRASEIAAARSLPPANRDAYSLYMSAMPHFWAHRNGDNDRAIELLTQALDADPDETRALAFRAWCHAQQASYMWSDDPAESRRLAIADADAAELRVAEHVPSLVAISAALAMSSLEQERPRALLDRALSLDANSAWGWMRSGWSWNFLGDPDRAIADFDRAEQLSPRDPFLFNFHFGRSFAHGILGNHEMSIALVRKGRLAGPGVAWAYRDLASAYSRAGRAEEAAEALRKLLSHYPGLTMQLIVDSMPPAAAHRNAGFFEGLKAVGVPDG